MPSPLAAAAVISVAVTTQSWRRCTGSRRKRRPRLAALPEVCMKTAELIAIDVHTHAEVSCRQPHDEVWQAYDEAASTYFKAGKRPSWCSTPMAS